LVKLDNNTNYKESEKRIFRSEKVNGNFTQICNDIIYNNKLTSKAKIILIYALSKPSNWKLNVNEMINNLKEGETAIRNGIRELVDHGYMNQYPLKEKGIIKEWIIEAFESPSLNSKINENPDVENPDVENPDVENPDVENPDVENPDVENHQHNNTNNTNTDFNNTDFNNTPPYPPNKKNEHIQGNEIKKMGRVGVVDIKKFIKNNFHNDHADMLLSVYSNLNEPKEMNIDFINAYKNALERTNETDILKLRNKLITLINDMRDGLNIKSLVGLMIYRFNNDYVPEIIEDRKNDNILIDMGDHYKQGNSIVPKWLYEQREQRKRIKQLRED